MPTYFGDSDIGAMLADAGRPVTIAGVAMIGIVDYVGKDALATVGIAGITGTAITVSVQTSKLPAGLKNRAAVTVDGVAYKIRDLQPAGDGAVTHMLCEGTA